MSTKSRLAMLAAAALCGGLAAPAACTRPAATPDEAAVRQHCFVGDRLCVDDAFDIAKDLLRTNDLPLRGDLLLVATGTIEDVHDLPDSLDIEREVQATFAIDWLHRYQTGRFVYGAGGGIEDWMPLFEKSFMRTRGLGWPGQFDLDLTGDRNDPTRLVGEWVRSRMATGPRKRIAIHLSSDLFVWPASGTSRGVARMGSEERERHESTQRQADALVAKLEAGELEGEEHRRLLLDFEDGPVGGGRFVEDRGGALEVGGRYLFALGDKVEGEQDAYCFKEAAHYHTTWRVFWGGEMEDVDRALRELASCLLPLSILENPPTEDYAWSICEAAARYRGAEREPVVVRQRPIGQERRLSPLALP